MKTLLFALFSLLLLGCASDESSRDSRPTQFVPDTSKRYEIQGCENLKREIEKYNEEHPEEQLTADC